MLCHPPGIRYFPERQALACIGETGGPIAQSSPVAVLRLRIPESTRTPMCFSHTTLAPVHKTAFLRHRGLRSRIDIGFHAKCLHL